jgi:hypothetical protein
MDRMSHGIQLYIINRFYPLIVSVDRIGQIVNLASESLELFFEASSGGAAEVPEVATDGDGDEEDSDADQDGDQVGAGNASSDVQHQLRGVGSLLTLRAIARKSGLILADQDAQYNKRNTQHGNDAHTHPMNHVLYSTENIFSDCKNDTGAWTDLLLLY